MTTRVVPKPVLKWAGGKRALVPELLARFPRRFGCYLEPFLGGASVALALDAERARLSDANGWLIDTYRAIADDWRGVAAELERLPNTKADFLRVRARDPLRLAPAARAAQLVYLNKTCFRGLFRVNRQGRFNVPWGGYDRRYYDPANLEAVARFLGGAELACRDFGEALAEARAGDFVYLDPPYVKLGGHADFDRYTPGKFRAEDHARLAAACRELDARGVRFALSNSDTELARELYAGWRVVELEARREINLDSRARGVRELLFTNVPEEDARGRSG